MKLDLATAKKLYNDKTTQDWFKKQLETEFSKQLLKEFNYKNIKSFEDACEVLGYDAKNLPDVSHLAIEFAKPIIAYYKLVVIIKAINNGWTPDWANSNQYKYYTWFYVLSSGSGFSDTGYCYTYSCTVVGSRLCVDSKDKALYIAEQFKDLYEDYLLLK